MVPVDDADLAVTADRGRVALERRPPPSIANKIGRGIWEAVWLLLYRPSPRPLHGWRRFLLRCFGAKIASDAKPYPSASIWAPWNLEMGESSTLGDHVDCYSVATVRIGAFASVSQRAYLCTASRDIDDPARTLLTAPILIGDYAWVAAEAYVGPGVTVRDGGVVAVRGVAIRDVPPWTVVGGNPASVIRQRKPLK